MNPLDPQLNPESSSGEQEASHAMELLKRKPDEKYISDWTKQYGEKKEEEEEVAEISLIIFRLDKKWFAMTTTVFSEIMTMRKVHHIPHCENEMLIGLVNFRGRLTPCVDLQHVLEIKSEKDALSGKSEEERMLVVQDKGDLWIFPVSEVYGVSHCDRHEVENVPEEAGRSKDNFLRGIIRWDGRDVGYLDEELLYSRLKRGMV